MWPNKRLKLCISAIIEDDFGTMALCSGFVVASQNVVQKIMLLENEEHLRIPFFYEEWIERYLEHDFFMHFRLRKNTFEGLYCKIREQYDEPNFRGGYQPMSLEKQLLICLWYLAKGEVMYSIADRFNVAVSSIYESVDMVLKLLNKLIPIYIKWPSKEECVKIESSFKATGGYPGVIGAIDGCHFKSKIPIAQHDSYQDRKFQHSVSMQGICDANMSFTNISVGYPGSVHDARILKESKMYKIIEEHGPDELFYDNYHLIGDSAYPCHIWLMTPYKDNGNLTRSQKKHNYILSRTRVKIENSFGQLKGRWRILLYINVYSVKKATSVIEACCLLHNFVCKPMIKQMTFLKM